jgi:thiamine pyrophosphokinase
MSVKNRVCIIANTPHFDLDCVIQRIAQSDLVIATDGAANSLSEGLAPHIICGDFDSIDLPAARERFPQAELVHSTCQESNDLEKCIAVALSRQASEIAISCAMGGRLDQTVTTLSLLERYHREVPIVLHEGGRTCRVVSSSCSKDERLDVATGVGDTISLVPRGDGAVVSLANVRWPLSRERLVPGSRGVSNEATGSVVSLTVHEGVVFFFHAPCQ